MIGRSTVRSSVYCPPFREGYRKNKKTINEGEGVGVSLYTLTRVVRRWFVHETSIRRIMVCILDVAKRRFRYIETFVPRKASLETTSEVSTGRDLEVDLMSFF